MTEKQAYSILFSVRFCLYYSTLSLSLSLSLSFAFSIQQHPLSDGYSGDFQLLERRRVFCQGVEVVKRVKTYNGRVE